MSDVSHGSGMDSLHLDRLSLTLNLWYDARAETAQSMMRPSRANAPTRLSSVPKRARIRFDNGIVQEVVPEAYEELHRRGSHAARFIIERAMFDPSATVEPLQAN